MSDRGVQFPLVGGRRSTQQTGQDVVAAAAAAVEPGLAAQIRAERSWRTAYPQHLRQLTEAAAVSAPAGVAVADAGLERAQTVFEYESDDGVAPLRAAITTGPRVSFDTRTVTGTGEHAGRLVVPYRGRQLRGDELLETVDDWVRRGVVEPPLRAALGDVVANPAWLDLRGVWFGVLGAGAEMAPTAQLLEWGADVAAVDVPVSSVWERLERAGTAGTGRLHAPIADEGGRPPGADLIVDPAAIRQWLGALDKPLVLGNYGYADGAQFTRLSVAADAVLAALRNERPDHGVVCLATPTDVFVVPADVAADVRKRPAGMIARTVAPLVRTVTGGRLLVPNHRATVHTAAGDDLGIADSLVLQQGPNYALAKRIQRWRALVTAAAGAFGAVHVAPPTRTRSVTRNGVLAAAYDGASLFGVEIFAPETSRVVMAALLVHDLRVHERSAGGAGPRAEHELTAAAAHGGLWRVAWETRSAFPFAIARGAPVALVRR